MFDRFLMLVVIFFVASGSYSSARAQILNQTYTEDHRVVMKTVSLSHAHEGAAEQIKSFGARVTYGFDRHGDWYTVFVWNGFSPEKHNIYGGVLPVDKFDRLRVVLLLDDSLRDSQLKGIRKLSSVQELVIVSPHITDAGLKTICEAKTLEKLTIRCTKLSGKGLLQVLALKSLRELTLLKASKIPLEAVVKIKETIPKCHIFLDRIPDAKTEADEIDGKVELIAKGGPVSETLDAEVRELRVKLQQAQRERDILKKALAILSRQE